MLFLRSAGQSKAANIIVDRLFYNPGGQILISILFGIALAFMFQRVCKGDKCIIFDAPPPEEIDGKIYEFEGACYQYVARIIACGGAGAAAA